MANLYRIQQWEHDISSGEAEDPEDIDFNTLEEACLWWENNAIPARS